jgi:methyl-accepting chemotaxis protein
MVGVSVWQSGAFADAARTDVGELVDDSVARVTDGVYDVVSTQGESTAAAVATDMDVAQYVVQESGGLTVAPTSRGTVAWDAKNQVSGEVTPVAFPRVMVGGRWLEQNADPDVASPVVDRVRSLVGATATVFQRIPGTGNMLRVATNVISASGTRAIGTYIPEQGAAGTPNPVVAAVLAGTTDNGTALVVDSWYVTSYAPLFDGTGAWSG